MSSAVNMIVGAAVSVVVLLILAEDRLDGDELWKGALVGPAVVGACMFAQSHAAQSMIGGLVSRWVK